jgi:hypothetical protein
MRFSFALAAALVTFTCAAPAAADLTVFEAPSVADLKLDLYGWVQPRFSDQQQDNRPTVSFDPIPAFTVARTRMGTVARLGPWARAQVEVDFSGEYAVPYDAYVVLSPVHEKMGTLNLTAGQFRVPFSRQNLLPSVGYQLPDVAYFVAPSFLVDRDIGGMISSDLFDHRLRLELGMFDGNTPGKGQTIKQDPDFLYAARVTATPFGPVPRFEGDVRPLGEQHRFVLSIGAGMMKHRATDLHFDRTWAGGDIAAYWQGASLYGEIFYHVDNPIAVPGTPVGDRIRQVGANLQGGYFLPLPWVQEHVELVVRVEFFDPATDVTHPNGDSGSRDLNQSNPTWGYLGYVLGVNYFLDHRHTAKAQVSYEIRDETKPCLLGQVEPHCTGTIANNLFVAQITVGF